MLRDFELHASRANHARVRSRGMSCHSSGLLQTHAKPAMQVVKPSPSADDTNAPRSSASGKLNLSLAFTLVPVCGNTQQQLIEEQVQVVLAGDSTADIAASTWVSIAGLKLASFLQHRMTSR